MAAITVTSNINADNITIACGALGNVAFNDLNPDTIVRASGSWITDGVVVGSKVTFTKAGGSNNGLTYTVTVVVALTITVSENVVAEASTSGYSAVRSWENNDTLTINNNAIVTVNTNQTKFWTGITIAYGKLSVVNASTSNMIRFLMGRSTGTVAVNSITPSSGLGSIEFVGNWIEIGTGNGGSQTFQIPQAAGAVNVTDYIPCVWVETASGSGIYEIWMNATVTYGQGLPFRRGNETSIGLNEFSKFFTQSFNSEPYTNTNPVRTHSTRNLNFGDYNNAVPSGAKVRIPNIIVTDESPVNYYSTTSQFATRTQNCAFNLSSGGSLSVDKALFVQSYLNGTQAQNLTLRNTGFCIPPLISEVYTLVIDNMAICTDPVIRYQSNSTLWINRDNRYWTVTWNYINNASITNLYILADDCSSTANVLSAPLLIQNSVGISADTIVVYLKNKMPRSAITTSAHIGLHLTLLSNCTFNNYVGLGNAGVYAFECSNCTFNGVKLSEGIFHETTNLAANFRIGVDPATGNALVNNTPYYFKVRSYRNYWNITDYYDNPITYSATPYAGHNTLTTQDKPNHPFYFGGGPVYDYANSRWTAVFTWFNNNAAGVLLPTGASPAYEVYRSTVADTLGNNVSGTIAASTTVTWTDPTSVAAAVNLTFANVAKTITRSAGSWVTDLIVVGCRVTFTTALNSASYTVSNVTATVLTINESPVNEGPVAISAYFKGSALADSTTYYYTLRKYDATGIYTDSAQQRVITPTAASVVRSSNLITQSSAADNAYWTKTNVTATANSRLSPLETSVGTASGDTLTWTGTANNIFVNAAAITVSASTAYTFSCYMASNDVSGCDVNIEIEVVASTPVSANCVLNQTWQRFSVSQTSTTGGAVGFVRIKNTANSLSKVTYVVLCTLEPSSSYKFALATSGSAATNIIGYQELTTLRPWSKDGGQGVELALNTAPSGVLWSEVFMGTSAGFTPSVTNMVASSWTGGNSYAIQLMSCNLMTFKNVSKINYGGWSAGSLIYLNQTTNSKFITGTFDFNYGGNIFVNAGNLSNNNFFHNWTINNLRSYVAGLFTVNNNSQNLVFQNIKSNIGDMFINPGWLGCVMRGVVGGRSVQLEGPASTIVLDNGTDGLELNYTTTYDTDYHLMYFSSSLGCLFLCFNASTLSNKPYTLSGTASFNNSGKLYLPASGDSITYTWPYKIYGVSGLTASTGYQVITPMGSTTFANTGKTITRTSGSWIAEGVTSGTVLLFSGTVSNNTSYTVEKVTSATVIQCISSNTLVDETVSNPNYVKYFEPVVRTVDCGNMTRKGHLIYKEYSIDTGSGYSSWKELKYSNLVTESVSASTGFYLKIRLTQRSGFPWDTKSNGGFDLACVGQTVQNASSSPTKTGTILSYEDEGTVGTLCITPLTGTWADNDTLFCSGTQRALINKATPTLLPAYTSYIDGLELICQVDQTVLYPEASPTLTLTGVQVGSEIRVLKDSDNTELAGIESTDSSTWSTTYEYKGSSISVHIVVLALGYKYLRISGITLTDTDLSIPVQQEIDRVYNNP